MDKVEPDYSFSLTENFISRFKGKQPKWGPLGYFTFKRTYARKLPSGGTEEFWQTLQRVVEATFQIQKRHCRWWNLPWSEHRAQRSAQEMFRLMWEFKFLPPGRGLANMGTSAMWERGGACLNNPLDLNTKVLTKEFGWIKLGALKDHETVTVLTSLKNYGSNAKKIRENTAVSQSKWVKGIVSPIEEHPCSEIILRDRAGFKVKIVSSENHRWFRRKNTKEPWERVTTEQLSINDYLPITQPQHNWKGCTTGYQHGFFFGDGTRSNGELHQFNESIEVLKKLFKDDEIEFISSKHAVVRHLPLAWGYFPSDQYLEDKRYLYSFIAGYVAADGHVSHSGRVFLSSSKEDDLKVIKSISEFLGIRCSDPVLAIKKGAKNNFYSQGRPSDLFRIQFNPADLNENFFLKESHKEKWKNGQYTNIKRDWYKVEQISKVGKRKVRCIEVPGYEQFVIEGFVLTSNCGFVSTADIYDDFSNPFCWLMDMSMHGVGVGFDTEGAFGKALYVKKPRTSTKEIFEVADTREGWVEAFRRILDAYVGRDSMPKEFNFDKIRPAGSPILTFGGIAPGPDPLKKLLHKTVTILDSYAKTGSPVDSTLIVDLMNFAGEAVVAGGVRRTAEIAFGRPSDEQFRLLKSQENIENSELARWASNNSILATTGMDYTEAAKSSAINGEPGFFWLENARAYGRMHDGKNYKDHRARGANPCGEQTLEPYELCVTPDTRIQTKTGLFKIRDLEGHDVEVWNGKEWSKVTPFKTSDNSKIVRVHFNDGSYLDCTEYHKFSIRKKTSRKFKVVNAINLKKGDILPKFNLGKTIGKSVPFSYEYGLFAGDGFIDNGNTLICMQEKAISKIEPEGVRYSPQRPKGYSCPIQRVKLFLDPIMCKELRDYSCGLPEAMFSWSSDSILNFVAGLIDTDGSIGNKGKNGEYYRIYGSELKLRDLQLLLRRANINRTCLKLFAKKGSLTNKGVRNNDLWMLNIHSKYCKIIPTRYRKGVNFSSGERINNRYKNSVISAERLQKVDRIEPIGTSTTYCFYEPKEGMGVFGPVLTYQCNLVETFPSRHKDMDEYINTLKYAYLYAKTVTLVATHDPRTNAVMFRNRRIGLSQTGIIENINKIGFRKHMEWCENGYQKVSEWDQIYSDWLCVPKSIKRTTVKPSGTVSLLPGCTPGIHFPHSEYYIRRVEVNESSNLWRIMEKAGYHVEKSVYKDNTMVVEFLVHEPNYQRNKNEISIWEQFELAAAMQAKWSDNQVSITITVRPEEAKDLPRALSMYEKRLKAVSFLPLRGDKLYKQAPYETITKEVYEERVKKLKKFSLSNIDDKLEERFCDGDSCTI